MNVTGKTPEEIKKALYQCGRGEFPCSECAYYDESEKRAGCGYVLNLHTLAYIEQLETILKIKVTLLKSKLVQLERERNTAIEDIKKAATFLCQTCKKYHPAVIDGTKHFCDEIPADHFGDGAIACGMYEWRGIEEEKDENA